MIPCFFIRFWKLLRCSPTFFAAWVTVETEAGDTAEYRIVGADEIDHKPGYISIDSPLARALLKRGLDDEVKVVTPAGERRYWILDIRYE